MSKEYIEDEAEEDFEEELLSTSSSSSGEEEEEEEEEMENEDVQVEEPPRRKRKLRRIESDSEEEGEAELVQLTRTGRVLVIFTGVDAESILLATARELDLSDRGFQVLCTATSGSNFNTDDGVKDLERDHGRHGKEVSDYIIKLFNTDATSSVDLRSNGYIGEFDRTIILSMY